jgi:hypothetical protein
MLAINLVSRTLFSIDIGTRELRETVTAMARLAATPTVSDMFPAVAAADIQGARSRMTALGRHVYRIIDEQFMQRKCDRDVGAPKKNDMMDLVLDKEKEWKEEGSQMNYDAVRGMFTVRTYVHGRIPRIQIDKVQ